MVEFVQNLAAPEGPRKPTLATGPNARSLILRPRGRIHPPNVSRAQRNPTETSFIATAEGVRYAEPVPRAKGPDAVALRRGLGVKVIHGVEAVDPPIDGAVLTVGNFDGVHRAHRRLLAHARELADQAHAPVVVLTFEPHPLTVVTPQKAPPRLTLAADKIGYLREAGADIVVVARSEPRLLGLLAEDFVRDVLVRRFRPAHLVEGPSFGFGRGRQGNPELLGRLAAIYGYHLHVVDPVTVTLDDGSQAMVSSSLIRRLLLETNVERAAECLARPYALVGEVVRGDGRGRTMAFPTANLEIHDQLVPADGVYAGRTWVAGRPHLSAINVGPAPTFDAPARRVESHVLDFDGDLYGATLRVEFRRFLRPQQRFASPDKLVEQLRRDVHAVRAEIEGNASAAPCVKEKP